ncbi:protein of unknown function [Azospirillum baldaniorum]|uniref:Uncharacterized protein n=1 Tax=Azospirillum baldaniorum TaxID=1064539 RepID=A0A9P1NL85_9PROT|nr:protein of unknown function [Azospirillum baldaniorum]
MSTTCAATWFTATTAVMTGRRASWRRCPAGQWTLPSSGGRLPATTPVVSRFRWLSPRSRRPPKARCFPWPSTSPWGCGAGTGRSMTLSVARWIGTARPSTPFSPISACPAWSSLGAEIEGLRGSVARGIGVSMAERRLMGCEHRRIYVRPQMD